MKRFVTLALVMALTLAFAACTPESPPLDPSSDAIASESASSTQDVSAPASSPDASAPEESAPDESAPEESTPEESAPDESGQTDLSVTNRYGVMCDGLVMESRELTKEEKADLVSFNSTRDSEYVYFYRCTPSEDGKTGAAEVCRYSFKTGKFYKYCTFAVHVPEDRRVFLPDFDVVPFPKDYIIFCIYDDMDLCCLNTAANKLTPPEETQEIASPEGGRWVHNVKDSDARLTCENGIFDMWSYGYTHPEYGKLGDTSFDPQTETAIVTFEKDGGVNVCLYDYENGMLSFLFFLEDGGDELFAYLDDKYVVHANYYSNGPGIDVYDVLKKKTNKYTLHKGSDSSYLVTSLTVGGKTVADEDMSMQAVYYKGKIVYAGGEIPLCETSLSTGKTREIGEYDTIRVSKDKLFLLAGAKLCSYDGKKTSPIANSVDYRRVFASEKYPSVLYYDTAAKQWKTAK